MGLGVVEKRGNKSKIYSIYNEIDDGQSMAVSPSTNLNQRLRGSKILSSGFRLLSTQFPINFLCFLSEIMSNRRTNLLTKSPHPVHVTNLVEAVFIK